MLKELFSDLQNKTIDKDDFKKYKITYFVKYNANGKSAIHYACDPLYNQINRFNFIEYLIKEKKVNVNQLTKNGYHPIHILMWNFNEKKIPETKNIINLFINYGSNLEFSKNILNITPLMLCVKHFKDVDFISNILSKHLVSYEYNGKDLLEYSNPLIYIYLHSLIFKNMTIKDYFNNVIKQMHDSLDKEKLKFEKRISQGEYIRIKDYKDIKNKIEIKYKNIKNREIDRRNSKLKIVQYNLKYKTKSIDVYRREFDLKEFEDEDKRLKNAKPLSDDDYKSIKKELFELEKKIKEKVILYEDDKQITHFKGYDTSKDITLNTIFYMYKYTNNPNVIIQFLKLFNDLTENQFIKPDHNIDENNKTYLHLLMTKKKLSYNNLDFNILIPFKDHLNIPDKFGKTPLMMFFNNYNPIEHKQLLEEIHILQKDLSNIKQFSEEETTLKETKIIETEDMINTIEDKLKKSIRDDLIKVLSKFDYTEVSKYIPIKKRYVHEVLKTIST